MITAGPAAAREGSEVKGPAAETAIAPAAQKTEPSTLKYSAEINKAARNLALLLERGGEIAPEKLDALAPELARFNGKLEETLGRDLLADAARREKELDDARRTEAAVKALQAFRSSLQVYYATNGGKYPADPAALAPDSIPAIPELYLPEHGRTAKITIIDSKKYDDDFARAVTDSGGWLYFSRPDSMNYGLLILDCRHKASGGTEFFKY